MPSAENERQRGGNSKSDGSNTERLSHMLPHVRVRRAGTGAALCKCLLAACGTVGEPHMFVLWSSHTGRPGTARLHRTGSFCLEPLITSAYFLIYLCVRVMPVCCAPLPTSCFHPLLLLSGSPRLPGPAAGTGRIRRRQREGGQGKAGRDFRDADAVSLQTQRRSEPAHNINIK